MHRTSVSFAALAVALASAWPAHAQGSQAAEAEATPPAANDAPAADAAGEIVVTSRRTRSTASLAGPEIQKILPGISPLKAIQTLPGVTYLTADPWGNNEQNISLFIHGFNAQQLGYTLDGVPLGDQQYGNYNGLSPQRATISENVGRVNLATGAGDLGTPSTSNLGGTIDTFTSDPKRDFGIGIQQTFGSYNAFRTFARIDTGTFGNGNSAYISAVRQDARAWDFRGQQGGYQANAKFVHDDPTGKLTLYYAYSQKTEPNEDATVVAPARRNATSGLLQTLENVPYVRPFFYPDFAGVQAYINNPVFAPSRDYNAAGDNYRNYYSAALRTDHLAYAKYDWRVSENVTWSNQGYYHHNDGAGLVAGPITAAGLPLLFSYYYPGPGGPGNAPTSQANLVRLNGIFGNSGLATRTTEYRIDRGGIVSTLRLDLGRHHIELGGWYEHQSSSAFRRWYGLDVNNPSSPYKLPLSYADPLITQYGSEVRVDEYQTHIQDAWKIFDRLTLSAGFKSTFQNARQRVPVQPIPGSFTGSTALPEGRINTSKAFLPQAGLLWDVAPGTQVFANAQKNVRQFQTSAAAGLSPFALGSQAAFELFKDTVKPETSWTYEVGARTDQQFDLGPITGFSGQVSYYHVDFHNRLLATSPTPVITAIVSGAAVLNNVGSVTTDGVDVAGTIRFGPHFSFYDALSYNNSRFDDDYTNGAALVSTAGKKVPGSPRWLNKFVATANAGMFDLQLVGDYIGRRYATFTNDLSVRGYFTLSGRLAATIPLGDGSRIKSLVASLNVTNITGKRAQSTLSIGAASGTYNFFPLAPRQFFGTLSFGF